MNIDYTELKEDIEEVINTRFADIADVIGDMLFEIENSLLEYKLAEVMKIKLLINHYAEDADNIIAESQMTVTKKMKTLFLKLEDDIEQYRLYRIEKSTILVK